MCLSSHLILRKIQVSENTETMNQQHGPVVDFGKYQRKLSMLECTCDLVHNMTIPVCFKMGELVACHQGNFEDLSN